MTGPRAAVASLLLLSGASAQDFPWQNASLPPVERVSLLLDAMTLDEKLTLLHGNSSANPIYTGFIPGNARLGIPPIVMNDGPQGYRDSSNWGFTTAWPSTLAIGATWSKDLARQYGDAMGAEYVTKGANVQLGPGERIDV